MGNYPDGNGSATQVSPNTDSDAATVNAAAANEELLTAADTAPNFAAVTPPTNAAPIGPWLKDVPANPGHYTIVVLNNGDGAITVDNGTGTPITPVAGQSPCLQLTS
jgi:hypothetical protein